MPYTKDDVPYVAGSGTSAAAAHATNATRDKGRVLDHIRRVGGATDDEVERALGMAHQTASARRRDLVLAGLVTESGHYRETCRGCTATVWISTKAGQIMSTNTKPNIKQTIDPKQCAAMRCKHPPTVWVSGIHWDFDQRMGVPLCDLHFTADLREAEAVLAEFSKETAPGTTTVFVPKEDLGAFIETHGEPAPKPSTTFDDAARSLVVATSKEADESIALVRDIKIECQEDLVFVNELLVDVKRKLNHVLEVEARVTEPHRALLESTRDLFRPAKQKLSVLEAVLKGKVAGAKAEEDASNRAALAQAAEAHKAGDADGTAAALAQVRHQTNVDSGVTTRVGWAWELVDIEQVPRVYMKLDESALNKLCKGATEPQQLPGIRFVQKDIVVVKTNGVQPEA